VILGIALAIQTFGESDFNFQSLERVKQRMTLFSFGQQGTLIFSENECT
jgi:hypothetical protein